MRRFRDYYRQFEEMPPEEVSLELRARRDEEKRRALSRTEPLDLSGAAWHEPPHPEAVNAATFALRRALNAYPDPSAGALREALAARHGVAPDQVALGHGAGELLRAACRELLAGGGDALVAWPGWQPLPELVEAAGGRAVPVAPNVAEIVERSGGHGPRAGAARRGAAGAPQAAKRAGAAHGGAAGAPQAAKRAGAAHRGAAGAPQAAKRAGATTRAVLLTSPADPTGAVLSRRAVRDICAGVPDGVTIVVDEALGEFEPDGDDAAGLVAEQPNLLVVRSFSKAHALAGLRAGAALGRAELVARLGPSGGISAPAQAAALWAVSDRGQEIAARRRAAAAAAHERLAAALAGSPLSALPASVPFAWISSDAEDGPAIAARLASRQVYVAPGALWRDDRHVRAALRGAAAIDRLAAALLDRRG